MKVILTGCTGMIGSETLRQSILHPSITSIIILSRRPLLPSKLSPKVKVIILPDFAAYNSWLWKDLAGAKACIWTLGGIPSKFPDLATAKKVNIDYPFEAAKAFIEHLAPQVPGGGKFRFLYVSGHAVDRNLEKKHWVFNDAIHIKGEIENKLNQLQQSNPDTFAAYLPRPGSVIPPNSMLLTIAGKLTNGLYPALKVEEFAAAMIGVAINGASEQIISHDDLKNKGRALLDKGA
ncbi:uncharacterized protein PAC_13855 [Phialocephala subalpina]|uniref:Nucleoside-diphosphate-sugar epimerases n=1 Tax=Phialocephala subalpina TaxID=576137 RepID=A0A1L7XG24_9HELO|nr:uncharacterized protein PAC_13855 [Phialocephala subalpina]